MITIEHYQHYKVGAIGKCFIHECTDDDADVVIYVRLLMWCGDVVNAVETCGHPVRSGMHKLQIY
jgi:hypothetical protein